MNWTRIRRVFGLLVLGFSLAVLVWGLWPLPRQTTSLAISPAEMRPADLGASLALATPPAIAEARALLVGWPPVTRLGDLATINLWFGLAEPASPPQPAADPPGQPGSVLAEARLDLPGLPHSPPGEVSQALTPGRPLTFVWDLLPVAAGEMHGTVWLHLRFLPSAGGPDVRQVLTAQRLQVRVIDFLGLSGPWARALGGAGLALGAALSLDGLAGWFWSRCSGKTGV